jgi:hypothetical protein
MWQIYLVLGWPFLRLMSLPLPLPPTPFFCFPVLVYWLETIRWVESGNTRLQKCLTHFKEPAEAFLKTHSHTQWTHSEQWTRSRGKRFIVLLHIRLLYAYSDWKRCPNQHTIALCIVFYYFYGAETFIQIFITSKVDESSHSNATYMDVDKMD